MGEFPQEPLRDTEKAGRIPRANEAFTVYQRILFQGSSPLWFIHSSYIARRKPLIRLIQKARARCAIKRGRFGRVP